MAKFVKFHKVASSANDTNISTYVNLDHTNYFVTAATTVILYLAGGQAETGAGTEFTMDDTITITTDGIASTKLVADGLAAICNGVGFEGKPATAIGAGFNGAAITTITVITAA